MAFFNRRKNKDRRSEKNRKKGEASEIKKPNKRSGEDRRKVIDQIIDSLEKDMK